MNPWLLTTLIVAGSLVLLLVVLAFLLTRLARAAQRRLLVLLRNESPLRQKNGALFAGRASQKIRLSGNGILALTPTRLLFVMWVPRIDLELPLSHVRGARVESTYLGRLPMKPILVVTFVDRAGKQDECGFVLWNASEWAAEVVSRVTPPPKVP